MGAAIEEFAGALPIALLAAALCLVIAYFAHQRLIGWATGASGVTPKEAPELYNALENQCISRGLSMPALQIIKSPALNAYASGLREGQYVVAVTRGRSTALPMTSSKPSWATNSRISATATRS